MVEPLGRLEFTPKMKAVRGKDYVEKPIPKSYLGLVYCWYRLCVRYDTRPLARVGALVRLTLIRHAMCNVSDRVRSVDADTPTSGARTLDKVIATVVLLEHVATGRERLV